MKYRTRMTTVEAIQWNQPGDHPLVKTPAEAEQEGWWTPEVGVTYDPQTQGVLQATDGPVMVGVGMWIVDDSGTISTRTSTDFEQLFTPLRGHKKYQPPQP